MGNFTPLIKIGPLFLHSFSPYLDAFLIPFLPSGRCAVDHSSSFWIKAGVIFPSPAPKPALSPLGKPLWVRGPASCGPSCCRAPGLLLLHPTPILKKRGAPSRQGPCPPHSPLHTPRHTLVFRETYMDRCFQVRNAAEFPTQNLRNNELFSPSLAFLLKKFFLFYIGA